jgi:hypothetical protein
MFLQVPKNHKMKIYYISNDVGSLIEIVEWEGIGVLTSSAPPKSEKKRAFYPEFSGGRSFHPLTLGPKNLS